MKDFVELDYKNKEEWHELRKSAIGGSDVATIMQLQSLFTWIFYLFR